MDEFKDAIQATQWRSRHLAAAHASHATGKPCGCVGHDFAGQIVVCPCGAMYDLGEASSFPYWHCYDCGSVRSTRWLMGDQSGEGN